MFGLPWFRKRSLRSKEDSGKDLEAEVVSGPSGRVARINTDGLTRADAAALTQRMAEETGFPPFRGTIDHGYDAAEVKDPDRCPRCGRETEPRYADVIYSIKGGARVLTCPFGRFCPDCPTVVVDMEQLRGLIDRKYQFRGVLGVALPGGGEPNFFRTWNGARTIFIGDEEAGELELATVPRSGETRPERSAKPVKKEKQRRRMAKQSRRRSRGK